VESLRIDAHDAEPACWLHETTFCLSTRALEA
jgi:hypothetical protein